MVLHRVLMLLHGTPRTTDAYLGRGTPASGLRNNMLFNRGQTVNVKFTAIAILGALLLFSVPVAADTTKDCHVGAYRLSDGSVVDIAPYDDDTLRWLTFTGERGQLHPEKNGIWTSTYGWTDRPDGKIVSFSDCDKGEITFGKEVGRRIAFDVSNTTFESDGVKLVGRLVLPKGGGKVPVVVLVHGSEHDSALDTYAFQRLFPAQGIGAFVYDKRGTGVSGGSYTQDFNVLAGDAIAGMKEAKRLAGARLGRIGYQGGSEGGWVVPLAANREHVDFAIVSFGLAVTVLEEDQESVALDMDLHHHSVADTAKALELASAGEHVVETGGKEGYEQFEVLRQKYKSEPWYKDVHGDFVFFIMPLDQKQIIDAIAEFGLQRTPFRYEPMPALRASATPQLWVLGSDDLEAPSAETDKRIKSLIADGKDYTLALYPGAEHGMTEYELNTKGERVSTRFAPGYFQMMADFIRDGRIGWHYGNAQISQPPRIGRRQN
jgi:pimeloyl-ACP methyl ester carboxylesterase